MLPYLDIPLQHASGPVLKRMNRSGDVQSLTAQLAHIRLLIDDLAERIPNLRSQMLRSLSNLQPGYLLDPRYLVRDDFDGKVMDNPSFEPQTGEDPG